MEKFTITLSDGTKLKDLEMNGNNYISASEIDTGVFDENLSPVVISNGKTAEIHQQMVLVQNVRHEDGRYWFILRDVTTEELVSAKLRSDIDFIAMMADIEL